MIFFFFLCRIFLLSPLGWLAWLLLLKLYYFLFGSLFGSREFFAVPLC
jgi:hypothetical protein